MIISVRVLRQRHHSSLFVMFPGLVQEDLPLFPSVCFSLCCSTRPFPRTRVIRSAIGLVLCLLLKEQAISFGFSHAESFFPLVSHLQRYLAVCGGPSSSIPISGSASKSHPLLYPHSPMFCLVHWSGPCSFCFLKEALFSGPTPSFFASNATNRQIIESQISLFSHTFSGIPSFIPKPLTGVLFILLDCLWRLLGGSRGACVPVEPD